MTKIEYSLKNSLNGLSKKNAQEIGETIRSITDKHAGKLKPEFVVNDAKDKDHLLHNYFIWDNTEAGKKYRLCQARDLISSITEVVIVEGKPSDQRSFHSVTDSGDRTDKAYVTLKAVISKDSYRKEMLKRLRSTLQNATILLTLLIENEK